MEPEIAKSTRSSAPNGVAASARDSDV
jgi:hypothetical protein